MPSVIPLSPGLRQLAQSIYDFEATGTQAGTPTGSRKDGDRFEDWVLRYWQALADHGQAGGAAGEALARSTSSRGRRWRRLDLDDRSLYLPVGSAGDCRTASSRESSWLEHRYPTRDLVEGFPGSQEAIRRYSPDTGPYRGEDYAGIYERRSTSFDGVILLVEQDVLKEKVLLEYKTAKSTRGRALDGNAHERLSFQALQYLEVATRYSACSFVVVANGAFSKYQNKYHVNFHVQADRLRVFRWFDMRFLSTASEYGEYALGLMEWLLTGERA